MGASKKILQKLKGSKDRNYRDEWNKTLEKLEKKEKFFRENASREFVQALEFTRAKDETAAMQCLKKKKLYEQRIEPLENSKLQILEQMIMLEGVEAAAWAVDTLKIGAAAMKAMNIDDVDNIMDNIKEQHETMKQMIEAVAAPSGAVALFDEDELKAELAKLKGAE